MLLSTSSYESSDSSSESSFFHSDDDEYGGVDDEDLPEMGEMPEIDDEPGIAVENQLRIKEQSAKAIEILTSHLLSSVWQGCSKNTYGKRLLFLAFF